MGDGGEPVIHNRHLPPRCHYCGRKVRWWQRGGYGGWGPIGFKPREASTVWHSVCLERRTEARREGRRVEYRMD